MNEIWYDATLYVRQPGSPGVPDHRIQVDARITVKIRADWPNRQDRQDAAKRAAEQRFRKLGLGAVMDLEGATVRIDVVPL